MTCESRRSGMPPYCVLPGASSDAQLSSSRRRSRLSISRWLNFIPTKHDEALASKGLRHRFIAIQHLVSNAFAYHDVVDRTAPFAMKRIAVISRHVRLHSLPQAVPLGPCASLAVLAFIAVLLLCRR
jgi:hypothetical protein